MCRPWLAYPLSIVCLALNSASAQDGVMWGGSPTRNNVSASSQAPTEWEVGEFDRTTQLWKRETSRNVRWVARVGSRSYGGPLVADGRVFVGTNNGAGYMPRYPAEIDLGCLLAFRESDGQFLWQYSAPKLPSGRVHDWPMQGIGSTPLVQGNRMWFVDNRGRVVCLDTEGFHDGEDDGPVRGEWEIVSDTESLLESQLSRNVHDADVVWRLDMMTKLGVSQHNMANCSPVTWGDTLFVSTSNGVDESHLNIPAPQAPSFIAIDKKSGQLLWTDNSPGENILHGQWSSPAVGELGGVPQVIFAGGDGWVYSFRADTWDKETEKPILLWKFDCNSKESKLIIGGRGSRIGIVATPVIYDGRVYVAVGDDPTYWEGEGRLWCIDPTRRGDVSPQLARKQVDGKPTAIPNRRVQSVIREKGEFTIDNPNSAAIWSYVGSDLNGDGKFDDDEIMHRTISTPAIKNGLLIIPDLQGVTHCLDARTGQCHWTFDLRAGCWASPLIVGDKVYVGDEDGDMAILRLSADAMKIRLGARERNKRGEIVAADPLANVPTGSCIYTTPTVVNEVLYFTNNQGLFAIATDP